VHPVDVPKRTTRIRVQWNSGAVSEILIARPGKGDYRTHTPKAVERIRDLAAAGLRDDEIAQQLNTDGVRTGANLAWKEDLVRGARRTHAINRVAPDRQRMPPLPHRHPDGRYSVPGAAARFGVSHAVVYAWVKHGLVNSSRADFGTHHDAYWLEIDDVTAARLAARLRRRAQAIRRRAKA
jgi:hypothetical protein